MPIPDYQSLMLPVVQLAGDDKEHPLPQIRQQIAAELKLTEKELAERLASDRQTVFVSRIAWAVQFLKQAGVLNATKRGVYRISERGRLLLNGHPSEITVKTLRQFPEFVEFEGHSSGSETAATGPVAALPESKATPEESLESNFQVLRDALANDLL